MINDKDIVIDRLEMMNWGGSKYIKFDGEEMKLPTDFKISRKTIVRIHYRKG